MRQASTPYNSIYAVLVAVAGTERWSVR